MSQTEDEPDWKLKLRYGKLSTPYSHFTALAEGIVGDLADGFLCHQGPAFMSMKMWASSNDESADMIRVIGNQIGFTVTGDIHIYQTEPLRPSGDKPFGYDINFTPFDADSEDNDDSTSL